eukprot:1182529-Lingulodinium_polyedra.AAC.1
MQLPAGVRLQHSVSALWYFARSALAGGRVQVHTDRALGDSEPGSWDAPLDRLLHSLPACRAAAHPTHAGICP